MGTFGPAYSEEKDGERIKTQFGSILYYMLDQSTGVRTEAEAFDFGVFKALFEIAEATGYPESSISAQLRHAKKERFGSYGLAKRRRHDAALWEYCLYAPSHIATEQIPLSLEA